MHSSEPSSLPESEPLSVPTFVLESLDGTSVDESVEISFPLEIAEPGFFVLIDSA